MTQSASEPWTDVHIEHLPQGPRGAGWYWWADGFDDDKQGPFKTDGKAHRDIFMLKQEADGR